MGQIGRYKTPDELRDEDKWFKFFTLPQLAAICGVVAADGCMVTLWGKVGLIGVGICLAVIITAFSLALIFLKMPKRRYLMGGGLPLYEIALRIVQKKKRRKRVIYVKAGFLSGEEDDFGKEKIFE